MRNVFLLSIFIVFTLFSCKQSDSVLIKNTNPDKVDKVFICDDNGKCTLLNAKTGEKIWEFQTDKYILSSPTFENNTIFLSTTQDDKKSKIIALDFGTGSKKWEFNTLSRNVSSPLVINNKLYNVSYDFNGQNFNDYLSKIYCIDSKTGKQIWANESKRFKDSSPTYYNGNIYFLSDLNLEIYQAENGSIQKNLRVSETRNIDNINGLDTFHSSPIVSSDICYYQIDNKLIAYNIKTKESKFLELQSISPTSPTIENEVLYVSDAFNLYAIDIKTFQKKWIYNFSNRFAGWITSPIVNKNEVYGTGGGKIFSVDANTGKEKWSTEIGSWKAYSSPNFYDSILYLCNGQNLIALSSTNGSIIWEYKLNNSGLGIFSSPLVISSGGEVFHTSISGAKM